MMIPDPQAETVYKCEWITPYWASCQKFTTIDDAQYRLKDIQTSRIWAEKTRIPAGRVELIYEHTNTFAGMMGFSFNSWHHPYIKLSQHGMREAVLLHELSHYITEVRTGGLAEGHGMEFARVLLGMYQWFVSEEACRDLMGWFDLAGVQYGI
jgi:hypothetical protein